MEKKVTQGFRPTSTRLRSDSDLLSKYMRKCVISLIRRGLVHLEQSTVRASTPRRHSERSGGRRRDLDATPGSLAALPAGPSKTSLRRSSNMSSSASLMIPRLPAAELCTTSMCSPSSSRSWIQQEPIHAYVQWSAPAVKNIRPALEYFLISCMRIEST